VAITLALFYCATALDILDDALLRELVEVRPHTRSQEVWDFDSLSKKMDYALFSALLGWKATAETRHHHLIVTLDPNKRIEAIWFPGTKERQ
jgi:hypothetical protein